MLKEIKIEAESVKQRLLLNDKNVPELKDKTINDQVKFTLEGKVVGMQQGENGGKEYVVEIDTKNQKKEENNRVDNELERSPEAEKQGKKSVVLEENKKEEE